MFGCPDLKMTFSFTVINSSAAITLETINNSKAFKQEFFRWHIFKGNLPRALVGDFKKSFSLQKGCLKKFRIHFLISNDFLPGNKKKQINPFLGKVQINWRLLFYIKFLGYTLLRKIYLNFKIYHAEFNKKNKS